MVIDFYKWNWRTVEQLRKFHAFSWATRRQPVECPAALNVLREDEATALYELEKMLADGLIEESKSAWAAPRILVLKSNGTYRFYVDYRKLNAVTKTDAYPMPRIDELLQSTKKSCVMNSLDLRSGYWQVSIADRDKTTFLLLV